MNLRYSLVFILLIAFSFSASYSSTLPDTSVIDSLNQKGYEMRLTDPEKSLVLAQNALQLSKKIQYTNGSAEAHRILGIGYYYLGKNDRAISSYLTSLSHFKESKNLEGEAKVYNNIGNLYKEVNVEKALEYFQKALSIAKKLDAPEIIAGHYLNIGIINYRKKNYALALQNTKKSYEIFSELENPTGITLSLQNTGVIYNSLNMTDKAEEFLLKAYLRAKAATQNNTVASINLTLVAIYTKSKNYFKAEHFLKEGIRYATIGKDSKLQSDYLRRAYELELMRNNHKQALHYLQKLYTQDSIDLENTITKKFDLFEEQSKFQAREKESAIKLEKAKTNRVLFLASITISALALLLIIILFLNVKKKAKTNRQLKVLNEEISIQKENLNAVNQNLEKIIDERTKDLKIKNRKLSEYSSHLSHQIRGPIATMKGLLLLEQEELIEEKEFIHEMGKCVNEIDDRIININDVLHNLSESGLIPSIVDKENKS